MTTLSLWRIAPGVSNVQGAAGFGLRGHSSGEKFTQPERPRELPTSRDSIPLAARPFAVARRAFTLVELLTVIAIVAVLIALLMPGIKGVRDQVRNVVCLSNLRQMVTAAGIYIEMNDARYPPAYWNGTPRPNVFVNANWDYRVTIDWNTGGTKTITTGLLWSGGVASRIQQCPVFKGSSNTIVEEPHTGYNYNTSYIGHGQGETIPTPAKATLIRRPFKCALFGDGQWRAGANKFMRAPWPNPGDAGFFGRYAGTQGFRHRGRTNVAFCDGHAESWEALHTETSPSEQQEIADGTGFLSADNSMYDLD